MQQLVLLVATVCRKLFTVELHNARPIAPCIV